MNNLNTKVDITAFRRKLANDLARPICFRTGKPWATPTFIDDYIAALADEHIPQVHIAGHHYHKKGERVFDEEQIRQECSTVNKYTLLGGDLFGNTPEEHAHSDYVCY